jgi:lipocalin-like protein
VAKLAALVRASAEQFKAATQNVVANFGTWSVNEADKTLTRHSEGALIPNAEGNDAKVSVSVAGDELKVVGLLPNSPSSEAVFRRFETDT